MGLLSRCSPQDLADLKDACERDLLAFTVLFFKIRMNMRFKLNHHHELIADALMALYRGEIRNLLINMPPGGTKTELAVIHFMAWCLARNPMCRFLHLSASDKLASLNSATVKEIVGLEEFQLMWPCGIRQDSRAKKFWNIERGGRTAGGVNATSTRGQVTGFRAGYMTEGFSGAIVIDDPLKPEDAWSKAKRETANRRLTDTIRSRRATDATPIIMIMQRLHEDDPAAQALAGKLGLKFEHLEIQAVLNESEAEEASYWPEKESMESLVELRDSDPYTFYAQYQQRPTPPGGALFKTDWILRYARLPEMVMVCIFLDTAMKTGEHNDYTAMLAAGTDGRNVYALDILRARLEAPDLLAECVKFYHLIVDVFIRDGDAPGSPLFGGMFVEDKASGTGLIQTLRRETSIPVMEIQRHTDKVFRAQAAVPYVKSGRLWIPESADLKWASYLGELATFSPALTHRFDDQVDVTCDAIDHFLIRQNYMVSRRDYS